MTPDDTDQRQNRVNTRGDGLSATSWIGIASAIAVVVLGFGAWWTFGLDRGSGMGGEMDAGMGGDMADMAQDVPRFPPVAAYYDGEQVFFAHTETSDKKISDVLTGMMGSPVLTVPELARTPQDTLGTVYVFTNGVRPDGPRGPMGFQPDVFDSAPGDPDYIPLRQLVQLTWNNDAKPRVLTSSDQVQQAVDTGQLSIKRTDVVINAPLLTWPGGKR
jgi:hypothetical protein